MAANQSIALALFGAFLCSSLLNSVAAQTLPTSPEPDDECMMAGGECKLVCPGEQIENVECPNARMACCRKMDTTSPTVPTIPPAPTTPTLPPVTMPPPGDATACEEAGGKCMLKCLPGSSPVPDMECPDMTMCCMEGEMTTTTTEPPTTLSSRG